MSELKSVSAGVQVPSASSPTDFDDYVVPTPPTVGVIMQDNFEDGTFSMVGDGFWRDGNRTSISTNNPKTGNYSIKMFFPGGSCAGYSEQKFAFNTRHLEIWLRFDLYIPDGTESWGGAAYFHPNSGSCVGSYNNKGPVCFYGDEYASRTGGSGSIFIQLFPESNGQSSGKAMGFAWINGVQTLDEGLLCQNTQACTGGNGGLQIKSEDRGKWIEVITHIKMASIANNDGVLESWRTDSNGIRTKLVDIQEAPTYSTEFETDVPSSGYMNGYLLGANNSDFAEDTYMFIDNFVASTESLL